MPIQTLTVDVRASLNDTQIPGCPYRTEIHAKEVFAFTHTISTLATFLNVLSGYIPTSTVRLAAFFLRVSAAATVAINFDPDAEDPVVLSLGANQILGWTHGTVPHSSAAPAVMLSVAQATTINVVVAILD